jgi:hypothetical protein
MSKLYSYFGAAGDVWENSSTQQHKLGTKAETSDGRIFRYVKVGAAALVPGKVYDCPATVANHTNIAVASAAAIGATTVTVTLGATAATANQYAEGYLVISDATGEGYTYQIKSHPAADASASLTLTLSDSIRVALTTSSEVTLIANPYNGVIIHATTKTGIPVGVAVQAVTAAYYGWVQSRGVTSCLSDASVTTLGDSVAASATTAGSNTVGTGVLSPIGNAITAGVSTEYRPIHLTID